MSRYIDAFKLKKKLREIHQRSITIDRMLKIIDEQPTAEVQEHGEWIESGIENSYDVICSKCGYIESTKTPFCSECGAKMDKE